MTFVTSAFRDPQGAQSFGGLLWRLAGATRATDPRKPLVHEWNAVWTSGELQRYRNRVTIPAESVQEGLTYRVRLRMKDDTGRWSHWSKPVQFTVVVAVKPTSTGTR